LRLFSYSSALESYEGDAVSMVILGFTCLDLTSSCYRLSRKPRGRQIKDEKKKRRHGDISLDGSSHQTSDAAFSPTTSRDLQYSRAHTDSLN